MKKKTGIEDSIEKLDGASVHNDKNSDVKVFKDTAIYTRKSTHL